MDAAVAQQPVPAKPNVVNAISDFRTQRTVGAPERDLAAAAQAGTGENATPAVASLNEVIKQASDDTAEANREVAEAEEAVAMTAVGGGSPVSASVPKDAFIPPAPMSRSRIDSLGAPASAASSAPVPSGHSVGGAESEPQRSRPKVASLFASVMGAGRGARTPKPPVQPDFSKEHSTRAGEDGGRLGAPNPEERLPSSKQEDDLLDIPAFLRRQAN
jgi:cell division protein FtsZ